MNTPNITVILHGTGHQLLIDRKSLNLKPDSNQHHHHQRNALVLPARVLRHLKIDNCFSNSRLHPILTSQKAGAAGKHVEGTHDHSP